MGDDTRPNFEIRCRSESIIGHNNDNQNLVSLDLSTDNHDTGTTHPAIDPPESTHTIGNNTSGSNDPDSVVHVFRIHSAAVQGKSQYLHTLIAGGFRESRYGSVDMQEHPTIVVVMLWYMYQNAIWSKESVDWSPDLKDFAPSLVTDHENKLISLATLHESALLWGVRTLQKRILCLVRAFFRRPIVVWSKPSTSVGAAFKALEEAMIYIFDDENCISETFRKVVANFSFTTTPSHCLKLLCESVPGLIPYLDAEKLYHIRMNGIYADVVGPQRDGAMEEEEEEEECL